VDEKSRIQALDRSQPILPMRPAQAERRAHDYRRNGTTSLFAALDTKTGKIIGQLHRRHRSLEFRKFLYKIDAQVPTALEVHLILDNYGTHNTATIQRWLLKRPPFTSTSHPPVLRGSIFERWFGLLTAQQLRRNVFRSTRSLETTIRNYIDVHNEKLKPFIWTKTADEILDGVARFRTRH